MTITLTREEAQQVLDALTRIRWAAGERDKKNRVRDFDEAMDVSGEAIETLRARLSAPEPERLLKLGDMEQRAFDQECGFLSAAAPPQRKEPEPVADKYLMEVECTKCGAKQDGILTINAPPQREWQRLTAYEIQELHLENLNWGNFACAIEAKLKEKNT